MEEISQVDLVVIGPILVVDHRLALARVLDQPIVLGSQTDRPTIDLATVFDRGKAADRRQGTSETFLG